MVYLTSILLTCGVMFLPYGINQNNLLMTIIGALCLGAYNSICYHKVESK